MQRLTKEDRPWGPVVLTACPLTARANGRMAEAGPDGSGIPATPASGKISGTSATDVPAGQVYSGEIPDGTVFAPFVAGSFRL
jgi:hypothetical protein